MRFGVTYSFILQARSLEFNSITSINIYM